jgi:predicted murein hydrolase (TIGR00659 family)
LKALLPGWVSEPVFGMALTVIAYVASLRVQRRYPWLHPLFVTSGGIILLLVALRIPYEAYAVGGKVLEFFLGPATVALGVPLYRQFRRMKRSMAAILAGVTAGSATGIVIAGLSASLFGASQELVRSMMTKSVTTPIALELARELGGVPELAAVLTVLTGLFGSMFGPALLRRCGVRSDLPIGIAIGTAAHGIGTARLLRESEPQGAASSLAMALAGVITSVLAALLRNGL